MLRWLLLTVALAAPGRAQTAGDLYEEKTLAKIAALDESVDGVLGVAAIDLTTGKGFSYHGDVVFPQASVIKVPILIEMFRGERAGAFRLGDAVTIAPERAVGGSGTLQEALKKGPVKLTVRELITAMIESSDNTATNECIRMVGMERVNSRMDALGFGQTRLRRIMMDSAAARRNDENVSTPLEMAHLVERIYQGSVVDPDACREMISILKLVKGDIRKVVPANIEVAAKTGSITGVRNEVGIVFLPRRPFILSVMSTFMTTEEGPVAEAARIVYQHYERLGMANRYGHRVGAGAP